MKLQDLLRQSGIEVGNQDPNPKIEDIILDSRQARPDTLFVAQKGSQSDSHNYIEQAQEKGCQFFLVDKDFLSQPAVQKRIQKMQQQGGFFWSVPQTRPLISHLAATFYGHPSRHLFTVGVTGTKGKTSLTYLVEHLLQSLNISTAVIGTIDHHLGKKTWTTELTSPDPIQWQKRLKEFLELKAQGVVMEVSSHALDQHRADGIDFDAGVFLNLTHDHLDYHKTMENYFSAKEILFKKLLQQSQKKKVFAVIHRSDSYGRKLQVAANVQTISYGHESTFDLYFQTLDLNFQGSRFQLQSGTGLFSKTYDVFIPMIGEHNIENALAALATGLAYCLSRGEKNLDSQLSQLIKALSTFPGVPGRLQNVPRRQSAPHPAVFVDYAHSPDSLRRGLETLQHIRKTSKIPGKIWTIFGCGGDRDASKRPIMAEVAEQLSDFVILTSDNPRTEDPLKIIEEIKKGFQTQKYHQEPDRRKAIEWTLVKAQAQDIVLIAGKGHENYQILGTKKIPFSDLECVQNFWKE